MAKQSLTERLRARMNEKAKESKESKGNPLEWTPPVGTTRIRILPPVAEDDDFFYATHSFHYMPKDISKIGSTEKLEGTYLWTHKFYEVDVKGKTVRKKDPIDEAVAEWYDLGRKNDDQEMFALAGTLKRKRNFFFNVIVITHDEETGEDSYEYRILVDRSNEGKLARFICRKMGVAFFRDIEDKWVEKDSDVFDENDEFFDLIDMDEGHDLKIVKTQGKKNWDVSYDASVVVRKPRALSDEERELAAQAVDLRSYITYEEDYNVVKKALEKLIGDEDAEDDNDETPAKESRKPAGKATVAKDEEETSDDGGDEEAEETSKPAKKPAGKAPAKSYSKPAKTEVDDEEFEEMLDELDEDEE